ncbi:MAG: PH domain-containing protein [Oscillospiraceae bacterium]|nr:PH domain-containing protein [Oscillospiraceae bacterium]
MHRMLWLDDLREDKGYYYAANLIFPIFCCFLTGYAIHVLFLSFQEGTVLVGMVFALLVLLIDLINYCYLSWRSRRYSLDHNGIAVRGFFRQRTIPWSAIREAGQYSIRISNGREAPFRTFLLLFLRPSALKSMPSPLFLDRCWLFGRSVLPVRLTEERLREFEEEAPFSIRIYDWNELHLRYEPREDNWTAPPCPPFGMRKEWEDYCARQAAREAKRRKKR